MAYKKETIVSITKKAAELTKIYRNKKSSEINICISKGNKKIGRVLNVSLMPIMTCGNCKHCQGICYDIKACVQYKNVLDARVRNTVLVKDHRDIYFNKIKEACKRRKTNKFFRWHVAGDILDYDYFCQMVDIAREFPEFIFWTYTKMYYIVNEWCDKNGRENLPKNLSIMYSEWKTVDENGNYVVVPFDNPYNFPVFAVRFKGEDAPKMHRCPGNCDICKETKHGCPFGESSYADEH